MFSPVGAVDTDVDGADGMVAEAEGLTVEMLGMGKRVVMPLREAWCAVKRKIPAGRAIMPMTKTPATIHHVRLLRDDLRDALKIARDPAEHVVERKNADQAAFRVDDRNAADRL